VKLLMKYTTRHDLPGSGTYAEDVMRWRAKQLVTAGYGVDEVVDRFGFAPDIAEAAFFEAYPEVVG
jgi:hypothetical protein